MTTPTRACSRLTHAALPLAPLALLAVPDADAQIVYTNLGGISASGFPNSIYLDIGDVLTGGTGSARVNDPDFSFQFKFFTLWDGYETFTPAIQAYGPFIGDTSGSPVFTDPNYGYVFSLAPANQGLYFPGGPGAQAPFGLFDASSFGTTSYVAFLYNPVGNNNEVTDTYAGWIRLSADGNNGFTIVDFAYNSVPNQGIVIGDTGVTPVPEPATDAVLSGVAALLAGSVAIYRRRRATTAVSSTRT